MPEILPWCATCSKRVESAKSEWDDRDHVMTFVIRCHGEKETVIVPITSMQVGVIRWPLVSFDVARTISAGQTDAPTTTM